MCLAELEKLKFDWGFAVPGFKTTRCCGTGTCDVSVGTRKLDVPKIERRKDSRDPHITRLHYGSLRNSPTA